MKSVMAERGQITVPKAVRDALGLRPGDRLEITLDEGGFRARKATSDDPIEAVRGIITQWQSTDDALDDLRGREATEEQWNRP